MAKHWWTNEILTEQIRILRAVNLSGVKVMRGRLTAIRISNFATMVPANGLVLVCPVSSPGGFGPVLRGTHFDYITRCVYFRPMASAEEVTKQTITNAHLLTEALQAYPTLDAMVKVSGADILNVIGHIVGDIEWAPPEQGVLDELELQIDCAAWTITTETEAPL